MTPMKNRSSQKQEPLSAVRRQVAFVHALLDEVERTAPSTPDHGVKEQLIEELRRLGRFLQAVTAPDAGDAEQVRAVQRPATKEISMMTSFTAARALAFTFVAALLVGCTPKPPSDVAQAVGCSELENGKSAEPLYSGALRGVERIDRHSLKHGADDHVLEGVTLTLQGTNVDEKAMARALACHAAHAELRGLQGVAPAADPLRPPGGKAWVAVERQGADVIIRVTSPSEAVASQILVRATTLAARPELTSAEISVEPTPTKRP